LATDSIRMDAMVRDVSFASGSARVLLAALRSEEGKAGRFAYSATVVVVRIWYGIRIPRTKVATNPCGVRHLAVI
jgi:hypothetical protein